MKERALFWSEYGCAIDPWKLPRREYQAHLAIIEGMEKKRRKDMKKNKKK